MKRRNFIIAAAALAVAPVVTAKAAPQLIAGFDPAFNQDQWGVSVCNNSGGISNFTAGAVRVCLAPGQIFTSHLSTDAAKHLLDTINVGREYGIQITMLRTKIEGSWTI